MKVSDITKITIYHTGCIGCDRDGKLTPLHQFIIKNQLPLSILMYKRIELNRAWQKEAQELKIELPAVVVEYNEDTNVVMSYDSFVNEFVPKMEGKPKKKRRAARTSDATTTASDAPQANGVIDGKEEDNEEKAEG